MELFSLTHKSYTVKNRATQQQEHQTKTQGSSTVPFVSSKGPRTTPAYPTPNPTASLPGHPSTEISASTPKLRRKVLQLHLWVRTNTLTPTSQIAPRLWSDRFQTRLEVSLKHCFGRDRQRRAHPGPSDTAYVPLQHRPRQLCVR